MVKTLLVRLPIWPPRPYMVITFKALFLQNQLADGLETLYVLWVLQFYHDCSNNYLGLTLIYFKAKSNMENART